MRVPGRVPLAWVCPAALCVILPLATWAADWPTYRGDGARSGYTADPLENNLTQHWIHKPRHAPRPAWRGVDSRMPFDRAFHAVVAGDSLFFGSSADGSVTALDVVTGAVRWSFLTAGPVRFAPAISGDRALVVSDDGFLYCLATGDGKLLWKKRGHDDGSMVLGNGRLISRWPARGGPVIADGVVYWAAGIWPSEGVFIHATDISTGTTLWRNATAADIIMPQPHPGAIARSGVSAQGDLVLAGERLLVPTGRGVPAAFHNADGRFLFFHLQTFGKVGGSSTAASDSQFFNGGHAFDLATGRSASVTGHDVMAMAITPDAIVFATTNRVAGFDKSDLWLEKKAKDSKVEKSRQRVLREPRWRIPTSIATPSSMIVARDRIVVGGPGSVAVIDIPSRGAVFEKTIDGEAMGLASASGRLFVSSSTGAIYCFAPGGAPAPRASAAVTVSDPTPAAALAADEIIRNTGITEGYCVDIAGGDGSLAIALAQKTALHICVLNADPREAARLRARVAATGLLGKVAVYDWAPPPENLPRYFANLVICGRSFNAGRDAIPPKLAERVLRPFGGKSCFGKPGAMRAATRGDLKNAGDWTHQYGDAANTCCSSDSLLRGPLGVAWFNDLEFTMPSRHGRGPAPLFYKGLLFVEGMHGLRCVDAYNGRRLWDHSLPEILQPYDGEHLMGVSGTGSNICVGDAGLFIRMEDKCLRLDPHTGKLLATFAPPCGPDGKAGKWGTVACAGNTLIGSLANTEHTVTYRFQPGDMRQQWTESDLLFAMDAVTGAVRWTWKPRDSIRHNAIAIGGGRLYAIDRPVAASDRTREKKRSVPDPSFAHPEGRLVALDLKTGRVVWESGDNIYGTLLTLSDAHRTLLMCFQDTRFKLASEIGGRLAAFDTTDGKRRWDIRAFYTTRPIIHDRTILFQSRGWDILTGEPKSLAFVRSYGCGIPTASRHLMAFRSATLGYVDLDRPRETRSFGGIRPGCWINAIPAGGLLLMPDATDLCKCSYLIKTSIALQPMGDSATE